MTQRRQVRLLVAIVLIAGLLPATIGTVIEAMSMSARSIEGQDGWSGGTLPVSPSIDQVVDQSGLNQRTGTGAWRISNNTSLGGYNGNFAGWPFSPGLPVSAGQPSSGAVADQFTATLWFRSASASADGSNIEIDLGSVAGDDRNTFLALTNRADADGGLQLRAGEPDGATGNFIHPNHRHGHHPQCLPPPRHRRQLLRRTGERHRRICTGWSPTRQSPRRHDVRHLRGLLASLLGTPYVLSNRLFFRSGAAPSAFGAFADTAAQGFYFDDLFYAVANQSAPAFRLAAYATGFEPGFSAGSIQGQEAGPAERSRSPRASTRPLTSPVSTNAPGRETGGSQQHVFGRLQRGLLRVAVRPGAPGVRWPAASGAGADQFTATLWFRSASASADGSNIEIDLGSVLGDDRNTFLALTNRADGTAVCSLGNRARRRDRRLPSHRHHRHGNHTQCLPPPRHRRQVP